MKKTCPGVFNHWKENFIEPQGYSLYFLDSVQITQISVLRVTRPYQNLHIFFAGFLENI